MVRFAVALLLAVGAIVMGPAAAPIPAGAPSADAIMHEQRRLHRLRDEEEIESLQIFARSGAVKERKVVRHLAPNEMEMRDVRAETRTVVVVEKRIVDRGLKEWLFTEAELARAQP